MNIFDAKVLTIVSEDDKQFLATIPKSEELPLPIAIVKGSDRLLQSHEALIRSGYPFPDHALIGMLSLKYLTGASADTQKLVA